MKLGLTGKPLKRINIVLIGMPSAGKSTIGRKVATKLGRELFDCDKEAALRAGMPIPEIFSRYGEAEFRKIEAEVCKDLSKEQGKVIATGGGVVESEENMINLSQNGLVVYLETPLELLTPSESRPLSADMDKLRALYVRRKHIYERYADISIDNSRGQDASAADIIKILQDSCDIVQGKDREI